MWEYEELQVNMARAIAYVLEFNTTKSYHKLLMENPWFSLPLHEINPEQIWKANLESRLANFALHKAEETRRNVRAVYMELQHQVTVKFAEFLTPTIDPILVSLENTKIKETGDNGDGHVCGICQDEMVPGQNIKGMACKHSFHALCIYQWLNLKLECPLCRSKHEI